VPDRDDLDAAELAEAAGRILLDVRREPLEGKALGARGDRLSNEYLVAGLKRRHPGDAILSEESADDHARLGAERLWIVDPLDGTREFGEPGRDDWAVHVALWVRGVITAAAVALPARALVLSTASPPRVPAATARRLRFLVSRTRPPEWAGTVAASCGAELVPMGSAGAKTAAVILGEADAYLHGGGQYEWDSAAPAGVAAAAGLHVSRIDGSPLAYNQPNPLLPDLLVCRRELAKPLLEAIAAAGGK
jgi:3'(2'), 5'-bisphosphate nucleotidase